MRHRHALQGCGKVKHVHQARRGAEQPGHRQTDLLSRERWRLCSSSGSTRCGERRQVWTAAVAAAQRHTEWAQHGSAVADERRGAPALLSHAHVCACVAHTHTCMHHPQHPLLRF